MAQFGTLNGTKWHIKHITRHAMAHWWIRKHIFPCISSAFHGTLRHMGTIVPISTEALVAMRTLVKAGVSDEAIGRALRELLMSAPADIDVLNLSRGTAPQETTPPGGPAIGKPEVFPEPAQSSTLTPPLLATEESSTKPVPLKVRFGDGKASNVTVPAALLARVAGKLGSEDNARQKVRDLARKVPNEIENRSKWIQSALIEFLSS